MTSPAEEALKLQRPLPDGSLRTVSRGCRSLPIRCTAAILEHHRSPEARADETQRFLDPVPLFKLSQSGRYEE